METLVVDTTAFIKNTALQELGGQIVTVKEVVDEITSKRQIRRLVVLPYDLQIKDVFMENILHVTEFSKKTGDYPSLSATDIRVMALTYQLEKEKVGTSHLNKEPQMNRVVTFTHYISDDSKATAGFYFPEKKDTDDGNDDDYACDDKINDTSEKINTLDISKSEDVINVSDVDDVLVPITNDETGKICEDNSDCKDESSDDSDNDNASCSSYEDDSGWITPQNIAHKKQEINCDVSDKHMKVACITSDFAMQNVLKQMGLNVLSVDGRQIHQLRSFILRCYACFKTTSVMTKVFCPNCGNKTLKKVAISVNDGIQVIHLSSRKRLSARGKKFSLPTPKGGKHANNPILCEDQRIPDQRPSRLARTKNNPLDADYIAGFSPFVMRDVNSRSAMLGIRGTDLKTLIGRNPNMRKKNKKRK